MNYAETAKEIRKTVLKMIFSAQVSHIGSNFSCIDILTVLYEKLDPKKDKLIISKGWVAASSYALGVRKGYLPQEAIDTFCDGQSKYIGLLEPLGVFGAEFAGGSMGMGTAAAVAYAWSKKQFNEPGRIVVLESDGGMQVGINWESLWFADQHKLNNLTLIIDKNNFQAMSTTEDILNMKRLYGKLKEFGCEVFQIDGHNFNEIELALSCNSEKPIAIIANTIKGKGWKRAENNNLFHYLHLSDEDYKEALNELNST